MYDRPHRVEDGESRPTRQRVCLGSPIQSAARLGSVLLGF